MNSQDPFNKVPDRQRELFNKFSATATGHTAGDVIGAAINLLINAIRQSAPDWQKAEALFDEHLGISKQLLKDHYDSHGRKKGIFPYDQTIAVAHFMDPEKIRF